MPPQSQDLEAFFKNVEKLEGLPGDFDSDEGSSKDFESFFEKLSSLDDMNWSAKTSGGNGAGAPLGQNPAPAKAPKASSQENRAPRTKVSPWETLPPRGNGPPHSPRLAGAVTASKILLLAVALFCTGLTAGFLALSLPGKSAAKLPGAALLVNNGAIPAAGQGVSATPGGSSTAMATPKNAPLPEPQGLKITENGQVKARLAAGDTPTQAPIPPTAAARQTAATGVNPAREPQPHPETTATAAGDFALQVGACQSAGCVTRYRAILGSHVEPDTIQVLTRPGPNGQEPIRRIRIEPLTRTQALALREKLSAADGRFGKAYLVNRR